MSVLKVVVVLGLGVLTNVIAAQDTTTSKASSPAAVAAMAHFKKHANAYHVRNVETDLRVNVEGNSPSGKALRYGQYFQGVSVLNCGVNVTVDSAGSITYEENHTCDVDVDVKPRLTLQRVFLSAVAALKHAPGLELVEDGACLVVVPHGTKGMGELAKDVLAWTFAVSDGPKDESIDQWVFYVNAEDGRVLRYFKGESGVAAASQARTTTTTYDSRTAKLNSFFLLTAEAVIPAAGSRHSPYTLQSLCNGIGSVPPTYNCVAAPTILGNTARDASGRTSRNLLRSPIFSTNALVPFPDGAKVVFGNSAQDNSDRSTAATDVFLTLQLMSAFLKTVLNREGGVTGTDARIEMYVHRTDGNGGEAFWVGSPVSSPTTFSISAADIGTDTLGNARTNATAPDIIAHECGHGLNRATYMTRGTLTPGEAEAIEEANADILAAAFESKFSQSYRSTSVPEWIGEQTYVSNWVNGSLVPRVALRYMDNPPLDAHRDINNPGRTIASPACYSGMNSTLDSHYASGPYNHMFYLLATGGTSACDSSLSVTGVGYATATRLWYDVLVSKLLPTDGYRELHARWLASATALFGQDSPQFVAVDQAFKAIHAP